VPNASMLLRQPGASRAKQDQPFRREPFLGGLSQSLEKAVKGPGRGRTFRREPSLKTTPTRPFLSLLTH
jgi:hypothetical protein